MKLKISNTRTSGLSKKEHIVTKKTKSFSIRLRFLILSFVFQCFTTYSEIYYLTCYFCRKTMFPDLSVYADFYRMEQDNVKKYSTRRQEDIAFAFFINDKNGICSSF